MWIKTIFRTARPSILVNGSASKKFEMLCGLRQGDLLSPLPFNIVGEYLHPLPDKAMHMDIFRGIEIDSSCQLSHLQFADDTILFVRDDLHQGSAQNH